jgi:hypothetical protein
VAAVPTRRPQGHLCRPQPDLQPEAATASAAPPPSTAPARRPVRAAAHRSRARPPPQRRPQPHGLAERRLRPRPRSTGLIAGRQLRSANSRRRVDLGLGVHVHHPGGDEVGAGRCGRSVDQDIAAGLPAQGGRGTSLVGVGSLRSLGAGIDREPTRGAGGGIGGAGLGRRPGLLALVGVVLGGGHAHVPPDGVGDVVAPDRVGTRYGWVLPGCGVAERPLPGLIRRRRRTVLP